MSLVSKWIIGRRQDIQSYLEKKNAQKPSIAWWLKIYMINDVMQLANVFFRSVQGRDTLLSEENKIFFKLLSEVKERVAVKRVTTNIYLCSEVLDETNNTIHYEGNYLTKSKNLQDFIETLGFYPLQIFGNFGTFEQTGAFEKLLCIFHPFLYQH